VRNAPYTVQVEKLSDMQQSARAQKKWQARGGLAEATALVGREKTSAGFSYSISLIAKGVRMTAITRAAKWSPNPERPRLAARLLNNPVATNAKVPAKIKSLNMATHEASFCLSRAS
jgi:hypothetical protein